ncbi:MAG: hypothetical protein C0598_11270 [Marinilabiliales bacterium]|nr:MAG: hypothetical protein C0598_11270 [Marinilabiliales bacterium]
MKKTIKLLTLISFSFIIILSSCNSAKHTNSYRGIAKTKNGRFVKYKKQNPNKKFLAFKAKKKSKKITSEPKIEQPSQSITSIEGNNLLIADNSESSYQIYLKKDNVNPISKYTNPIVKDELLDKSTPTNKSNAKNQKYKQAKSSLSEPSKSTEAKYDWVSLVGFVLSIAAFGAILLATILGGGVFLLGLTFGIFAVIMGLKGLGRINKKFGELKGKGFALSAIIIGGSFLVLLTVLLIILIANLDVVQT